VFGDRETELLTAARAGEEEVKVKIQPKAPGISRLRAPTREGYIHHLVSGDHSSCDSSSA
jgi:hypothetical protein